MDRRIGQVDEGRQHLGITTGLVKLAGVPQRENSAHELHKVLLPLPIGRGAATCSLSVPQTGYDRHL